MLLFRHACRAALFFSVARTKEFFGASPENLLGYALAGSAAWGVATLAEGPIDLYKSQMQKQLIQARLVRVVGLRHPDGSHSLLMTLN